MAKFYLVGGAVRDELLGLKSKDLDYSCEAPSYEAMKQAIEDRGGQIFLENPEYFTIRARVPELGAADFVLCRKDGQYKDGRRPDKVEMGTLLDDLARRDFTVNAIAKDEDGNYIDPHGGIKDLEGGVLKCVGEPRDRFNEDALRILRALRFSLTKNLFISDSVHNVLIRHEVADSLKNVSGERVREELHKMFKHDTLGSLRLFNFYPLIEHTIFSTFDMWLMPTSRS